MSNGSLRLRRRCEAVIDRLDLPHALSVETLCRHLADRRSRPLRLHPLPPEAAAHGACGLWLATDAEDHIFYERRTAPLHQEHIVLHEIGHLLFNHRTMALDGAAGWSALLPDLDMHTVQRLLRRTNYATDEEQEAELFASLLGSRINNPNPQRPGGVLGRLEVAMGVDRPHDTP
ncbi:hypothetical protein AQI88_02105 [Streptomyces cellostaticus]|uniref:Regulator component n=1 Tax=Streptomyces cellostaticus TaxID=67285 RepID=A0A101NSF9_9ACTN|nr:hypothetical protein [Streptomyces cellostaticus]KUM98501.1 hypothetical protein AQI88_02105 [Streptomyces cellostaticus]GHI03103.1 hypothetical protein Scel_14240 [Streptomyces cellostaticus]